ncbi:putative mitochondrial protein [Andalucia godoyi]|uniref:Putative mitochondrial protein n=1 Tax=Andalucia godoyi TaxID=505711 RepID=A0A8K0AGN1_ANDGO|nr:putative mitochondrial protein [Andalucia godoyi]|eukprot:ANDGO_07462.mRNA.1 putative mitochondrial protein
MATMRSATLMSSWTQRASSYVVEAAHVLGRRFSHTSKKYVRNLPPRNYLQIRDVETVYAVAAFEGSPNLGVFSVDITGGTAWATQMFVMRHIRDDGQQPRSLPLYLFEQGMHNHWFQGEIIKVCKMMSDQLSIGKPDIIKEIFIWRPIDAAAVPVPSKAYAGIGSRELRPEAIKAMKDLFARIGDFEKQVVTKHLSLQ